MWAELVVLPPLQWRHNFKLQQTALILKMAAGGPSERPQTSSTTTPGGFDDRKRKEPKIPLVLFKTQFRNTIYDVLRNRYGWKQTESETDWDFYWADVGWIRENYDHMHFEDHQRVCHFRNHYELTRKDLLVKNVTRMRKQLERTDPEEAAKYAFIPTSFVLPDDYGLFLEAFKRFPGVMWIMKPIGKSQGKGIFLFTKLSDINNWKKDTRWKADGPQAETYIVQKYIPNPYTIGGKKFDLRLYALVTSFSPLTVWMYREGFGRFSFVRYTSNTSEVSNLRMHLTNVAIQKTATDYNKAQGCKWSVHNIKMFMTAKHGADAVNALFAEIQGIIIRALLSVQKVIIQNKHSFEMYGYDILIDSNLKPWVLEVNASPSLTADTQSDYQLKTRLLDDMLSVVDMEGRLTGKERQIGGFDLIWQNGPIRTNLPSSLDSRLGCYNDRETQLRALKKELAAARKAAGTST